ncbi:MAG: alpha/beta hydrolase [Candidatus Omnitrophica bacterium]|nr:alpha/beta hydrolase [Candidatus Omnitrophota bacterium]
MPSNIPDIIKPDELEALNSQAAFISVKDGRKIAYYQYGAKDGAPIFFCHGTGSHIHVMLLHNAAKRLGYRIIVPDRPGIGLSDFQPHRKILDGAGDIAALADHLGIEKFGVMGISGGGPTLLACAYSLAPRLKFVVDLACAVPLYTDRAALKELGWVDRLFAKLGAWLPLCLFQIPFAMLGFQQKTLKSPEAFAKMMQSSMCAADTELFRNKDLQYLFMRDFQELFRQGSRGPSLDAQLIYHPWGFDLSKIECHVEIRQGSEDRWIPPSFSRYLAGVLPNAKLHIIQGQGHFYHMVYAEETLKEIA